MNLNYGFIYRIFYSVQTTSRTQKKITVSNFYVNFGPSIQYSHL